MLYQASHLPQLNLNRETGYEKYAKTSMGIGALYGPSIPKEIKK